MIDLHDRAAAWARIVTAWTVCSAVVFAVVLSFGGVLFEGSDDWSLWAVFVFLLFGFPIILALLVVIWGSGFVVLWATRRSRAVDDRREFRAGLFAGSVLVSTMVLMYVLVWSWTVEGGVFSASVLVPMLAFSVALWFYLRRAEPAATTREPSPSSV